MMMSVQLLTMLGSAWGSRAKALTVSSEGWASPLTKTAARPPQSVFRCFPSASPSSWTETGKQKVISNERPKSSSFFKKSGAGEGIRTLDPNLAKVINWLRYGIQSPVISA